MVHTPQEILRLTAILMRTEEVRHLTESTAQKRKTETYGLYPRLLEEYNNQWEQPLGRDAFCIWASDIIQRGVDNNPPKVLEKDCKEWKQFTENMQLKRADAELEYAKENSNDKEKNVKSEYFALPDLKQEPEQHKKTEDPEKPLATTPPPSLPSQKAKGTIGTNEGMGQPSAVESKMDVATVEKEEPRKTEASEKPLATTPPPSPRSQKAKGTIVTNEGMGQPSAAKMDVAAVEKQELEQPKKAEEPKEPLATTPASTVTITKKVASAKGPSEKLKTDPKEQYLSLRNLNLLEEDDDEVDKTQSYEEDPYERLDSDNHTKIEGAREIYDNCEMFDNSAESIESTTTKEIPQQLEKQELEQHKKTEASEKPLATSNGNMKA